MIYGERIRLRADERSDLPEFVRWLNDPEVILGLAMQIPFSQADEEGWFERMLKLPPEQHPLAIEARLTANPEGEVSWKLIGNCGYHDINWRNRYGEVGIVIGEKAYWNQGYGTEAMQLLLRYGFNTLNLHRVFLRVYETNPRAIRCYEKTGFVHEGRLRKAEFRYGDYVDVLLMSVLQEEWKG